MALLRVKELIKTYGRRTVVDHVSFKLDSGEIVGLLGPNGAGKTTTFRMTVGMISPDAGTVFLNRTEITRLPMYKRARLGMGYLSQEPSVFRGLSVEDNVLSVLELEEKNKNDRAKIMDALLTELGLIRVRKSSAAVLSGGERRRLEITRALVTRPALILLDEPFSGIDPIAVADIQEIVKQLRDRGIGVLLTDHNVRETLATTDKSYIIYEGKIIARGNKEEILEDPNARKYYLGERFEM